MGVVLTPIVASRTLALDDLRGRSLAVDGNGELYQFLALIRLRVSPNLLTVTSLSTVKLCELLTPKGVAPPSLENNASCLLAKLPEAPCGKISWIRQPAAAPGRAALPGAPGLGSGISGPAACP